MTGDRQRLDGAQRELLRRHYPGWRRFAGVVAPKEVDPEDLVQEALLQVLRRSRLTDLDSPSAYVHRAIVNLASNHRRALGRRRMALARSGPLISAAPDSYPSDVEELFNLKPPARAVIYLRVIEGLAYREVARMLDMKESSARSTASRALRQLRVTLAEEVTRG